ncbi:SpoIIE family protein phosphatase [Streptomyces paradoxus]|uniref:SpoIIE family protein phosphatase n=1 Tax=Streptomyces paradoxus TaxID=66375 RepID=UPI00362F067B
MAGSRVALIVGDVTGHGLPGAATMGRPRTAVRTFAGLELPRRDHDPPQRHRGRHERGVVRHRSVRALRLTIRICGIARAGHPPPAQSARARTVWRRSRSAPVRGPVTRPTAQPMVPGSMSA